MTRPIPVCLVLAMVCATAVGSRAQSDPAVFINEIHYDNTGTDTGEFVEIAGPAGTSLTGYSIVLYNGAGGGIYDTDALSGVIPDQQNGFGTVSLSYPSNGIQNGSPDGIALVKNGEILQFLSYEGPMTIGVAPNQVTSIDIGVSENGTEPVGRSLQLQGTGTTYGDFTWAAPIAQTSGAVNAGQNFGGGAQPTLTIGDVTVNETNAGLVNATFTASLSAAAGPSGVGFNINTDDGSAHAGDDYVALSTTATIPPGASTHTFSVSVMGDTLFEPDETFFARITNPSGATIVDGDGQATIVNDDESTEPPVLPAVVINEIDADQSGTDAGEFIELFDGGAGGTSLNGLVVVLFNGSNDLSYARFDLTGRTTDAAGYFTLGNTAVAGVDLVFAANFLQNGADAVALYAASAASFPTNTAVTTANLIDAVVYDTDDTDDGGLLVLLNANQPQLNENDGGLAETNSLQRCPNGGGGTRNTTGFTGAAPTPGALNSCSPPAVTRTIPEIQGDEAASPYANTNVITTGVITGVKSNGFFIQSVTPDTLSDTSEGVFVFTGRLATVTDSGQVRPVRIGDLVEVNGRVVEFFEATEVSTVMPVSLLTASHSLPVALDAAQIFDPAAPSRTAQLERYEGMLVAAPPLRVVAPTNENGEFYAVIGDTPRPFREPGLAFDQNFERIMVETDEQIDATGVQRTPLQVSTGAAVTGVAGPLDFAFGEYRIQVAAATELATTGGIAAAVAVPVAADNEFTVASANLLNFFNPSEERLAKVSLLIRNVLRTPAILGVIEIGDLAALRQIRDRVNAEAGTMYEAYLIEADPTAGGEQNVGYLVDAARVDVIGEPYQLFAGKTFEFAGAVDTLHDRPPFMLEADVLRPPSGQRLRITVMLNHLRSLIDVDSTAPFIVNQRPTGFTIGERVREKRRLAAEDVADAIEARQGDNLIVMGDLNAFEFNDGLVDVVGTLQGTPAPAAEVVAPSIDRWDHTLFNLIEQIADPEQRYSYVFQGNAQTLDHVLISEPLLARFTRFQYARNNVDFPAALGNDASRSERFSDHDVPVAYFSFPTLTDVSVTPTTGGTVQTGSSVIYSVEVANAGPDPAATVTFSVTPHAAIGDVSMAIPDGWSCTTSPAVSCTTPSFAAGATVTFVLESTVSCGAADATLIAQSATVSTITAESSLANNAASLTVTATNPAPTISGFNSPVVVSPLANAPGAGAIVSDALLGTAVVSDNCAGAVVLRSGVPPGNLFPVGVTTITYTATDSGGAVSSAIATVEVLDSPSALALLIRDLELVAQQHQGTPIAQKINAALEPLRRALVELGELTPNVQRAVALTKAASGVLGELVRRGELPASIVARLEGVTWLLGLGL
jgi:predicted extracellular nuclease